jgi:hypothetical protein
VDKDNPVVKLCIEGQKAEVQGRSGYAFKCYLQAWKIRKNDLDACIAAHFVAKQQENVKGSLKWNMLALKFANKIQDDFVKDFYPSLYINIANTHEQLGMNKRAKKYYDLAFATVTESSLGSYGALLLESIKNGQRRTQHD